MTFKPVGIDEDSRFPARVEAQLNAAFVPLASDQADTAAAVGKRLILTDVPGAKGGMLGIEHWGDGSGAGNGQTWGLDIHNNPGAVTAFVIHQYSSKSPAFRLDNTDSGIGLQIAQTNNPVRNPNSAPDSDATGDAIRVIDHLGNPWFRVCGRGEVVINVPATSTLHAIEVVGNAAVAKRLLRLTSNAAAPALEILANAGAAGQYAMLVAGYNYGPAFTTSQNGGRTLSITKNGTGNGAAMEVTNKGTDPTVAFKNAAGDVSRVTPDGELEHLTAGKGLLLRSPDGTRYRVSVANGGAVSAVAA